MGGIALMAAVTITSILADVSSILTWFWDIFGDLLDTITGTPLFFLPVLGGLMVGFLYLAIRVVRRFGVRNRI